MATNGEGCISNPPGYDLSYLSPCTHEEADSRMMVHVASAAMDGHRDIMIRSKDSDVVVIAVWVAEQLDGRLDTLWIAFGNGLNMRYSSINFT